MPALPPAPPPRDDRVWVPDRYVDRPTGSVLVPGHWERRLNSREHYVPPLTVCGSAGACTEVPAGVRPPPDQRQGP